MKNYLRHDEWSIIEEGFHPEHNRISESVFSIGNGRMGQRANFEEGYGGETLQGSYVAGIYYPDKTRVGWWKNGYPEYFAKVLNAPNWIGLKIDIDGERLDLATCEVSHFRRVLNMKEGILERSFQARLKSGKEVKVHATRFCSIADDEAGAIRYSITLLNTSGVLSITSFIDADVVNQDANWEERFWREVEAKTKRNQGYVTAETKKTAFQVCTGMKFTIFQNGAETDFTPFHTHRDKYVECSIDLPTKKGVETVVYKYAAVVSSLNHPADQLMDHCKEVVKRSAKKGFDQMRLEQAAAWARKWEEADIRVDGDVAAQQGIRFNIFQLYQTYTGEDERLNIGPKGFTGEKYGGSTYWDTEAYCIPFYMATADQHVARQLLVYRHKQLQKAIENAEKLGFTAGAALYPMVTMNGEECHNEWEITFEEIHRNGAIAYAIYDYVRYTGDHGYLAEYGLDVLIAISRFWAQRVHFSERKQQYVMHGVTGPNEYENNVNNNWYTNYIAVWCLKYTLESIDFVQQQSAKRWKEIKAATRFDEKTESTKWQDIIKKMHFPQDKALGIYVQHEGFLDKDLLTVADLRPEDRPINQKWSWDRILRSVFIKQADVLQGLYFFEDQFNEATLRRNFDFYEPRTVHESSLSPCVHAILAAKLGKKEKAYEMYLRTARLDLDDYNNDTEDGCHITSMAGTWMAFVKGFGGMRVYNDMLHFSPYIPENWKGYSFKIRFRGMFIEVVVSQDEVQIVNRSKQSTALKVYGKKYTLKAEATLKVAHGTR